jgi:hypothetical protein
MLITVASLSYLMNPSPISLMSRLAAGDLNVGIADAAVYLVPLLALLALLFVGTNRLAKIKA